MNSKSIKHKITIRVVLICFATFIISVALAYLTITPYMKKRAIDSSNQINSEFIQQTDTLTEFVSDYAENLSLSVVHNSEIMKYFSEPTQQNQSLSSLKLNNLIRSDGIIRCVIIDSGENYTIDSQSKVTDKDYEILNSQWYQELKKLVFARGFSSVYEVEVNGTTYYTAAYLKNFNYSNHRYTYTIFFNLNSLLHDMGAIVGDSLDYFAIADSSGSVFSSVGDERWKDLAEISAKGDTLNSVENVRGGIKFIKSSINNKWRVISFVSLLTLFKQFSTLIIAIGAVLMLFLLLTLIILLKSLGEIIKPISKLSHIMNTVTDGDLDCQIEVTTDDEIGELGQSFNKMVRDLKQSIEIIAEKEKRDQQTQYSLLISQIDPHFINNTINSINYLARKGRCEDIIKVNSALMSILRDRLRVNDIQITDSIANEIDVLDQYIVIQKFMYGGDLKLEWQVDNDLMLEQIPKNIIQPIVENSIMHGLIDEESGNITGKIIIQIVEVDDNLMVSVKDNGRGMDSETLKRVRNERYSPEDRGKRIGLSNIRSRLYYLYGNSECMKIESELGKGTCITIILKKRSLMK